MQTISRSAIATTEPRNVSGGGWGEGNLCPLFTKETEEVGQDKRALSPVMEHCAHASSAPARYSTLNRSRALSLTLSYELIHKKECEEIVCFVTIVLCVGDVLF